MVCTPVREQLDAITGTAGVTASMLFFLARVCCVCYQRVRIEQTIVIVYRVKEEIIQQITLI